VLYNDSTYGLQIISADIVSDFTLGGNTEAESKAAYNSLIDDLNKECRKYVNTLYTKDLNSGRCVGSNPLSPDDTTTDTFMLQFEYNGTKESGLKVGDEEEYWKIDANAMDKATSNNVNGIKNLGKAYWLATRCVWSYSDKAYFNIRRVETDGSVSGSWAIYFLRSTGPDEAVKTSTCGLRPIITLDSNIKTNNGNGTEKRAFELMPKES